MTTKNKAHAHTEAATPTPLPVEPVTSKSDAVVTPQSIPCPPPGGATSSYQMSSSVQAVLTAYQYWFHKMHGHPNSTGVA